MSNTTKLTSNESEALKKTAQKLKGLRDCLNSLSLDETLDVRGLKKAVETILGIQGNLANEASLIACVLARQFLQLGFDIPEFDAAAKPQGAPGLDVDVQTSDRKRIIGEVKTTVPYEKKRRALGSNQKDSFETDFEKLKNTKADHKYFFVTHDSTLDVVEFRYGQMLREHGIKLQLLS